MEASMACVRPTQTHPRQSRKDHTREDIRQYQFLTKAGGAPKQEDSICEDPVAGKARAMHIGYTGDGGRGLVRKLVQFRNSAWVKH